MTLDKRSWGNRRDAAIEDFLTPQVLTIDIFAKNSVMGQKLEVASQ